MTIEGKSGGDIRPYNRTERKERYQRRKAGRRPGGSEISQIDELKIDEVKVDEEEVDEVEADEEVDEEDWYFWCCGKSGTVIFSGAIYFNTYKFV